ncbi:hypothetical protein GCM10008938_44200 [Deinococcus roseus]|uniref:Uncharacterized protein n=1 Tax=Deinococcus roseus TaxID=392414 RepID=A0ABQ2DG78_9DEIO|nr:hypothetical protein GCM10008938_44200 [Deinococcus roseus]
MPNYRTGTLHPLPIPTTLPEKNWVLLRWNGPAESTAGELTPGKMVPASPAVFQKFR